MADITKVKNEGVWRNEGWTEEIEPLKNSKFSAVTAESIPVFFQYDKNLSTSFQLRHVVDSNGNRGFMCFVDGRFSYEETYRQGTTQEVYDEVKKLGEAYQQEALRLAYINLERR